MCGRVGARARAQAQASARTLYVWCMYASRNVTLRTVDEIDPIVSPELVRVRARARAPARPPTGRDSRVARAAAGRGEAAGGPRCSRSLRLR